VERSELARHDCESRWADRRDGRQRHWTAVPRAGGTQAAPGPDARFPSGIGSECTAANRPNWLWHADTSAGHPSQLSVPRLAGRCAYRGFGRPDRSSRSSSQHLIRRTAARWLPVPAMGSSPLLLVAHGHWNRQGPGQRLNGPDPVLFLR